MPRRTWTVQLEDGSHTVELTHGYFSGKRTVKVDGEVVHDSRELWDIGGVYSFTVGEHHGFALIQLKFVTYRYDLVLDGVSLEMGKPTLPPLPMPTWGWPFVIACILVPIVTRGGAIPTVVGVGGVALCVHLLQDASLSKATRIGGSLGVTAVCWILFGMFFTPRILPSSDPCPLRAPRTLANAGGWMGHARRQV